MGNTETSLYRGNIQEDIINIHQVNYFDKVYFNKIINFQIGHHGLLAYPSCLTFGKFLNFVSLK